MEISTRIAFAGTSPSRILRPRILTRLPLGSVACDPTGTAKKLARRIAAKTQLKLNAVHGWIDNRKANSNMGSLKKRRKAKISKHKRRKRMRANRHKKRLRYKA
jgi:hypothetical protein